MPFSEVVRLNVNAVPLFGDNGQVTFAKML